MDVSSKTLKSSSRFRLPIALIFSCILPKLPAKSILRFKCVSKSFLTEISSPEFNALYSEANNRLLIVPGNYQTFHIYELDSGPYSPKFCPYPIPSKWDAPNISIVACCESYLLIGCGFIKYGRVVLLNSTTLIYHIIPRAPVPGLSSCVQYGMCHCSDEFNNDDFKIVRFVYYHHPRDSRVREVIVYSLRSNLWKRIEHKEAKTELIVDPVLVQNHLLVMICYRGGRMRIGCFDIKAERWSNDVLLSGIILDQIGSNSTPSNQYYLGVLDGKLRFSCYAVNKSTCDIWVMKEYGIKESWVKLMSVTNQGVYHPIGYHKGSSHELLCIPTNNRYGWYNLKDKQFNEMGYDCALGLDTRFFPFPYLCKRSVLNLPGGQPIRSSSKEQKEDEKDNYDDCVGVYKNKKNVPLNFEL